MRQTAFVILMLLTFLVTGCDKSPKQKVTVPIAHRAKVLDEKLGWTGLLLKSGQEVELVGSKKFIGVVNNEPYTAVLVFKNDEATGLRLGNRSILGATVKVFITAPKDDTGLESLYEKCSKTIIDPKSPLIQRLDLGHAFNVWLKENADARLRGVANTFKCSRDINTERARFNELIDKAVRDGAKAMKIPFIIEDVQLVDFTPTEPKPVPPPIKEKKAALKTKVSKKRAVPIDAIIIPTQKRR